MRLRGSSDSGQQASRAKTPDPEAFARANARVRKFVRSYVERGPYTLYPEPQVTENVIVGLVHNLAEHGKMYCPCADVESSKTEGHHMVCPCTPHHDDIKRQGYCDCALFASPVLPEPVSPEPVLPAFASGSCDKSGPHDETE
jgi:ferredoxin-thioredoxin reductase catalytic subunit